MIETMKITEKVYIVLKTKLDENSNPLTKKQITKEEFFVPHNIKIVQCLNGKLGLLFNDEKQVITSYNISDTIFNLALFDKKFHRVIPCKLVPTEPANIHIGDIVITSPLEYVNTDESTYSNELANITDQFNYAIKVTRTNGVSIQDEDCSILIHGLDDNFVLFKVTPVKL